MSCKQRRKIDRAASCAAGLLLAVLALSGCRAAEQPSAAASKPAEDSPQKLKAVKVQSVAWPRTVGVQGSLLADETTVLGAKVSNRVLRALVDVGSVVRRGDVMVELEPWDYDYRVQQVEGQLAQARSRIGLKSGQTEESLDPHKVPSAVQAEILRDQAQREFRRAQELLDENAIAKEEYEQRQSLLAVAEAKYAATLNDVREQLAAAVTRRAELRIAQQAREDTVVRAPFDGVVQVRHIAPGSFVQVGQAVVTMVRIDPVRFRGGVPEHDAAHVKQGLAAEVELEGVTGLRRGSITRVSPALDMANRSLLIDIDLPNPEMDLRVGLFGTAEVCVEPEAKALAAPASAVASFAGVEKAWVVADGKAVRRAVQVGRRSKDRVEILEGLEPGEIILVDADQTVAGPVAPELVETPDATVLKSGAH